MTPFDDPLVVCLVEIVEAAMERMNNGVDINVREAITLGEITGIACRAPGVMELLKERET